MATYSMLTNVSIKDKRLAKGLSDALESASGKKAKKVAMQHSVEEVKRDEIEKMFEDIDG